MKAKKLFYVGVRFNERHSRIFTYTTTKPVVRGDELVVENQYGINVAIVVRVDTTIPDYARGLELKKITRKVSSL